MSKVLKNNRSLRGVLSEVEGRRSNPLHGSVVLVIFILALSACQLFRGSSHREQADQLSKDKKYTEAVEAYRKHINDRLAVKNRPEWENPYLYLLDIGDVYLEQGNITEALKNYELAEEKEVTQSYVNGRYRQVAIWYEEQGKLKEALEHLRKYRERDVFLFDLMLDRIAKEIVKQEEVEE